jgi:hypothetical protein
MERENAKKDKKITFYDCDLLMRIAIVGGWISSAAFLFLTIIYLWIKFMGVS